MKVTAKITGAFRLLRHKTACGMSRICAWQRKSPDIPALSTGTVVCMNCGHSFEGNFCPQCGQWAKESKFTFKSVILKSLEVWGMENRSLLRTLWHLIYRPGYMIRDYIKGRRVPYYSPFSMLFLVATAYMMIHHFVVVDAEGVSDDVEDTHISKEEFLNVTDTASRQKAETFLDGINHFLDSLEGVIAFFDENSAFEAIFVHSIFAFITFLVFRRSSTWPRITLSESFLAQIFIASQMLLLSSLCVIATGVDDYEYSIYSMPLPLLVAVLCYDYKQLFGFSILSTVLKTAAVLLAWAISVVLIIVVTMTLTVLFSFFH